ncbi:hypothetical protein EDB81DRAFT_815950 [Dactylonectria macrodidyma]|uniref:BZIP domain-containing protein n=1 Tax=Dactylonectria macrodidyma TaxID=307937 RepID=A0A9P9DHJ9_9HYPO|nr:hypothetical protein EDB81DRAFT_815950 [Dactylonectria macrodidyma]
METHASYPVAQGHPPNYDTIQEQHTLDINAFETTQNPPWDPWSPTDPSVFFPGSSAAADMIGCAWGQDSFSPGGYVSHYPLDYPDLTTGFSTVTESSVPSLASEPIDPDTFSASSSSRSRSLATEKEPPKRQQSPEHRPCKSTKLHSHRDGDVDKHRDEVTENSKSRSPSRTRSSRKNGEDTPAQKVDDQYKLIQKRNRIASNKFRIKKREHASQLKSKEEELERRHRDLSGCVTDLRCEVYELKVRLLQHTNCSCVLIQDYIASEAKRYIQDLDQE